MTARPNILWIMTDEERFPPGYESGSIARWRAENLPGRQCQHRGHRQVGDRATPEARPLPGRDLSTCLTDGTTRLWKLNQIYERLPDWPADSGMPAPTGPLEGRLDPGEPTAPEWELYGLSTDPDERDNLLAPGRSEPEITARLRSLLEGTRLEQRLAPRH